MFLVLFGALVVAVTRWKPVVGFARSTAVVRVGQALLLLLVIVCTPNAVRSIADIVSR